MRLDERFHAYERLRRKADFDRVFAARCSAGDEWMAVHVAANGLEWSRLGVSAAKRIGNSVERHYVRRKIKEAFRRNKARLPAGFDIVCVPRQRAAERRCDVTPSLLALAAKAASRPRREPARTPKSR